MKFSKLFYKPKIKNNEFEYTEKEIIIDLIQKYIALANENGTTLDDYISIIALIKVLKNQYKNYQAELNQYLELFNEKGILNEYDTYSNITKKVFSENNYNLNITLAYDNLFNYFDGATNRFMNYLILFGLCGKPVTSKQKYIMSKIFQENASSFSKQRIYYNKLYQQDPFVMDSDSFINKNHEKEYIRFQNFQMYKDMALAYRREHKDKLFEENMLEASKYHYLANEDLCRYYINNKEFEKAKKCLEKIEIGEKEFAQKEKISYKNRYSKHLGPLVEYYNQRKNYPYIRKELLEMFNLDIKKFNELTKDIKDNIEYKNLTGYSEKIIDYLNMKTKQIDI